MNNSTYLYHFTRLEATIHILLSHLLLLNPISKVSDQAEINTAKNYVDALAEWFNKDKQEQNSFDNLKKKLQKVADNLYSASFSSSWQVPETENLVNGNQYRDKQERYVFIRFKKDKFHDYMPKAAIYTDVDNLSVYPQFKKMRYYEGISESLKLKKTINYRNGDELPIKKKEAKKLHSMLDKVNTYIEFSDQGKERLEELALDFLMDILSFKDARFKCEKEIRFLYAEPNLYQLSNYKAVEIESKGAYLNYHSNIGLCNDSELIEIIVEKKQLMRVRKIKEKSYYAFDGMEPLSQREVDIPTTINLNYGLNLNKLDYDVFFVGYTENDIRAMYQQIYPHADAQEINNFLEQYNNRLHYCSTHELENIME